MNIVITTGGSGGHIYPALSLIKELLKNKKNKIFFIGRKEGMEKKIISNVDVKYIGLDIRSLKSMVAIPKYYLNFKRNIKDCKIILNEINADIVIGFGNFVSLPVVLAATKLKIKTIIHEQNCIMGKANKYLSKKVDRVLLSMKTIEDGYLVGNPRSEEFFNNYNKEFHVGKNVLIFAGSQGSKTINNYILNNVNKLEKLKCKIHFVTGPRHYEHVLKNLKLTNNLQVHSYIDDMTKFLSNIDICITRAGATTISEMCAIGMPLILIPSPFVANNHQTINALELSKDGACKVVKESNISELVESLEQMLIKDNYKEIIKLKNKSVKNSIQEFIKNINEVVQ